MKDAIISIPMTKVVIFVFILHLIIL
jgi:hypothetical protein